MLSRDEIEGELRDVFAKMSDVELTRELGGEWRELVEAELARRREKSVILEAPAQDIPNLEAPAQDVIAYDATAHEVATQSAPAQDSPEEAAIAVIPAAEAPTPIPEGNWRSRIACFLRSILRRKSR